MFTRRADALPGAILLSLLFGAVSFVWSMLTLLAEPAVPYAPQYAFSLLIEIGGHVAFGFIAGLAAGSLPLSVLCALEAILIDFDHLLGASGIPVESRSAHSIAFIVLSCAIIGQAAGRQRLARRSAILVTLGAFLSHLAYDVYSGDGGFPLLFPFSLSTFYLPWLTWPLLELAAIIACASSRGRGHEQRNIRDSTTYIMRIKPNTSSMHSESPLM